MTRRVNVVAVVAVVVMIHDAGDVEDVVFVLIAGVPEFKANDC